MKLDWAGRSADSPGKTVSARTCRMILTVLALGGGVRAFVSARAQDSFTLPQEPQRGTLTDLALASARDALGPSAASGADVPATLQAAVLQALPATFQTACGRLLDAWAGDRVRASSDWRVRVVDRQDNTAWLAATCASRLTDSDLARYRDERLVRLRLDDGRLDVPALTTDDDSRDAVRRIEPGSRLSLPAGTGFVFIVHFDDNPCCDGPELRSQVRTVVFLETPAGPREVLSVVTARDNTSSSDGPDVDVETTYQADLTFDRDANGVVTGAHATFRDRVVETTWPANKATPRTRRDRTGTLRFRWNPVRLLFEPAT